MYLVLIVPICAWYWLSQYVPGTDSPNMYLVLPVIIWTWYWQWLYAPGTDSDNMDLGQAMLACIEGIIFVSFSSSLSWLVLSFSQSSLVSSSSLTSLVYSFSSSSSLASSPPYPSSSSLGFFSLFFSSTSLLDSQTDTLDIDWTVHTRKHARTRAHEHTQ